MTPFDNTIHEIIDLSWPLLLIATIIFIIIRLIDIFINKKEFIFYKEAFALVFLIYMLCLFQVVTFEDNTIELLQNNLTPFKEIFRYKFGSRLFIKNVLGNFLMFIPFGIFISISMKLNKKWQGLFLTFITSISVESFQLMIGRVFDIDDIILNVCGGMFGYFIYHIVFKARDLVPNFLKNRKVLNILALTLLIFMLYYFWRVILI